MPTIRPLIAALLAGLALVLAACGDDNDDTGDSAATVTTEAPPAETSPVEEQAETTPSESGSSSATSQKISKDLDTEPEIAKPSGDPPTALETKDIVKGKGTTAKKGDTVSVQYTGVSWSTGQKFDASWDRGKQAFPFELGAGMVIPGWDEGVAGMKEGGRRMLVIPPDQAYGPAGSPPAIGPNETLIFVVDLEKVEG
jgi:peptidylprolyl isomerase